MDLVDRNLGNDDGYVLNLSNPHASVCKIKGSAQRLVHNMNSIGCYCSGSVNNYEALSKLHNLPKPQSN